MSVRKVVRYGIAGALIGVMPVSTTVAAVRPNAAVPTAGSTAVVAQPDDRDRDGPGFGVAWAAIAVIALTIIVAIWIAIDKDRDGEGSLSRG